MIAGIGIDLVEIERIERFMSRQRRFPERILTENEREQYGRLKPARQLEFLAGRFAAKEAYAKAAGTGIGTSLSFQDMEVLSDEKGKPRLSVVGSIRHIHLSITHTRHYAAAQVVIENFSGSSD
ncbi:MAG TPA: holo-ACP synthase [Bacillales bacterium]|nr:holo-ACP synthase [Bacillales bacterium]